VASVEAPTIHLPQPAREAAPPAPYVPPALELRDVLPEERRQAWELQLEAFNLSEGGPHPHPGHGEELKVAVREGRVVSCLTLLHADVWMSGVRLPMGGVRHVATHPEEQGKGYASALLRATLQDLRGRGIPLSMLFPFSFRYYRKFGYELGGNHCHFWCRPNCIPAYEERRSVRRAEPEDVPALACFYAARALHSACSMARDEARWAAVRSTPGLQVAVHGEGEVDGFAVTAEERDAYGGRVLRVLDLAAGSRTAWRALLGHLSQFNGESVEWLASAADLSESGLLRTPAPLREGFKPRGIATVRPMFQARVVDVAAALQARLPTLGTAHCRLALRVRDELIPENATPLAIEAGAAGAVLVPARPADPTLDLDIQLFSQLYCGYLSPAEAVSQGLATASGPEATELAERLFPAGEPFISELDRF